MGVLNLTPTIRRELADAISDEYWDEAYKAHALDVLARTPDGPIAYSDSDPVDVEDEMSLPDPAFFGLLISYFYD